MWNFLWRDFHHCVNFCFNRFTHPNILFIQNLKRSFNDFDLIWLMNIWCVRSHRSDSPLFQTKHANPLPFCVLDVEKTGVKLKAALYVENRIFLRTVFIPSASNESRLWKRQFFKFVIVSAFLGNNTFIVEQSWVVVFRLAGSDFIWVAGTVARNRRVSVQTNSRAERLKGYLWGLKFRKHDWFVVCLGVVYMSVAFFLQFLLRLL
jgi:hypothetical protein